MIPQGNEGDEDEAASHPRAGAGKPGPRQFLRVFSRSAPTSQEIKQAIDTTGRKPITRKREKERRKALESIVERTPPPREAQEVLTPEPVVQELRSYEGSAQRFPDDRKVASYAGGAAYLGQGKSYAGVGAEKKAANAPSDAAKLRETMIGRFMRLNNPFNYLPAEIGTPTALVIKNQESYVSSRDRPYGV